MTPVEITAAFLSTEAPISSKPFGSGHINRTFLIITDAGNRYVLQSINTFVFPEPDKVMANVVAVTGHLRSKGMKALTFLPDADGQFAHRDPEGNCWRMYGFVDGLALDAPRCEEDLYQAGLAFGTFQQLLADFPAASLFETIPHFHNTPDRYRKFKAAVAADAVGRVKDVGAEIDWFLAREDVAGQLCRMYDRGSCPCGSPTTTPS